MKKCAKGTRRCSATKTCISRKKSRLATKKKMREWALLW